MNTRRQAKASSKYCKSEGSMSYLSPPSTLSSAYQIESDTSKGCILDNINTQPKCEEPSIRQRIIWEEDYNQLISLYKKLSTPTVSNVQAIKDLFSQLTQFSAAELLLKSQAPLWTKVRDDEIIQSYCQTIVSLSSLNFKCALIEKDQQKFIAVETSGTKKELKLLPAEPFSLEFFKKREIFLSQFKEKCLGQQDHRLSQLSTQIIFLYHEYHKLRQQIMDQINGKGIYEEHHLHNYEESMKELIKQLKLFRKARKNQQVPKNFS